MEGGSFGFQIGASETDVILLVMNARGADKLFSSQFTLGGEGDVAAGPVGRSATAQTDALMTAEILSWSRSRGVFAGISLQAPLCVRTWTPTRFFTEGELRTATSSGTASRRRLRLNYLHC